MKKKVTGPIDEDDLEKSAPNLFKAGKEKPFDVPNGYFDQLSRDILDKCLVSGSPQTRIVFFQKKYILAAASVIILVGFGLLLLFEHPWNRPAKMEAMNEQFRSEIEHYENSALFPDDSLIIGEIISGDALVANDTVTAAEEEWLVDDPGLSSEELIAYCVDEKIDLDSLVRL